MGLTGDPGPGSFSPGSILDLELDVDELLPEFFVEAADVTTVGCTVAVGGAAFVVPPGEAERMSGPAG